mmetsp:Transcript_19701/g.48360  ORF Transcript_19701/g.48360 Transcript_19701/m.48360 type:complete len:206 (-) Transcript_19701:763-1380(-)
MDSPQISQMCTGANQLSQVSQAHPTQNTLTEHAREPHRTPHPTHTALWGSTGGAGAASVHAMEALVLAVALLRVAIDRAEDLVHLRIIYVLLHDRDLHVGQRHVHEPPEIPLVRGRHERRHLLVILCPPIGHKPLLLLRPRLRPHLLEPRLRLRVGPAQQLLRLGLVLGDLLEVAHKELRLAVLVDAVHLRLELGRRPRLDPAPL